MSEYTTLVYDLRGHGRSELTAGGYFTSAGANITRRMNS